MPNLSAVFERLVDIICETMADSMDGVDANRNGGIPGQPTGQSNGVIGLGGGGEGAASNCQC
jgi:hypothetical protein